MAKPVDTKAKERKQKIVLGVGGVLLLGLLAFQLPKLMKGSSSPSAVVASGTTTTSTATPSAAGAASLAGNVSFAATKEKLPSFSRFKSKDPFVQLVSASAAGDSSGSSLGTSSGTPVAGAPAPGTATVTTGASSGAPIYGTVAGSSTKAGAPANGTGGKKPVTLPGATLKVNGVKMHVQLGDSFPEAKPIFRLAGITPGGVQVALIKGGLADGSSSLSVQKRHPMTLVNTADDKRYTIVFLSSNKT
jgi:hypothetical protein